MTISIRLLCTAWLLAGLSVAHGAATAAESNLWKKVMLVGAAGMLVGAFVPNNELAWDWNTIDTSKLDLPEDFVFGVSTAEYQISGSHHLPNTNWAMWEQQADLAPSGAACDLFARRDYELACLEQTHATSYRFSVDWSKIEPQEGVFDEAALDHYSDFIDALLARGIEPMVTIHHFVHPTWFDEKGGFEKRENIQYVVRFGEHIFKRLGDRVKLWVTINEPSIYAMQGYVRGVFPPGKSSRFGLAAQVLNNMLRTHVELYKTIKALPQGDQAQLGIAHDELQFETYYKFDVLGRTIAAAFNRLVNDATYHFFKDGEFRFSLGGLVSVHEACPEAKESYDFVGLNYYSHVLLGMFGGEYVVYGERYRSWEVKTDMPYAVYAEGLYRAIKRMATLGKPIYITENGCPDNQDTVRDLWIRRYLYAVNKAIADGCDVRGYYYWTLMDNWEWDWGYDIKYGLFAVNRDTLEATLRPGAQWFVDCAQRQKGLQATATRADAQASTVAMAEAATISV